MKHLMLGVAALALITGCTDKDKPKSETKLSELSVRAGDPAEAAAVLGAMSLTESGSGIVAFSGSKIDGAKATFDNVKLSGDETMTAGSLVLEGLDMIDGKASFGKLSLNNITITTPESETGEVKLGNIELVNPSPELGNWIAATLNGQTAAFPAADKLVFDSWSMSNLAGTVDDAEAEGTFGVGKIEIRDMKDLKAARATISDVKFDLLNLEDDMKINFSLDKIVADGVNAKFVKALQENAGDGEAVAAAIMDIMYENPMDPGYNSFTLSGLKADLAGASFAIPSVEAYVERNSAGQPVKYVSKPYKMTLKADAEGGEIGAGLLQGLSVVGYKELELTGESIATYDPDKDIVSFDAKSNYFELKDGAKFSFGGKIEGYSAYTKQVGSSFNFADLANGAEPDPTAMQEAMGALTIHSFELSIKDNSLMDRAFNAIATSQGQDPKAMKSQVAMGLGMAPMMAQGSGIDMALVTEATGALSKFIATPGTLTIKLNPKTPLSFAAIMANPDPSAFTKDSLGFSATAN